MYFDLVYLILDEMQSKIFGIYNYAINIDKNIFIFFQFELVLSCILHWTFDIRLLWTIH